MNTALRIVARIALVALAVLFLFPHIGVRVEAGLVPALGSAVGFEVFCWVFGSALAFGITSLGFKKENSAVVATIAFTGVVFALLLGLSAFAPAVLTVTSWQAAAFGTVALLIISGITTWRGKKPAA
jgi:hypothetical protein